MGEGYDRPVYLHLFADHYRSPWYAHYAIGRDGIGEAIAPPADQMLRPGDVTPWCNLTPTIYQDSGAALNLSMRHSYHEKAARFRAKLEFGRAGARSSSATAGPTAEPRTPRGRSRQDVRRRGEAQRAGHHRAAGLGVAPRTSRGSSGTVNSRRRSAGWPMRSPGRRTAESPSDSVSRQREHRRLRTAGRCGGARSRTEDARLFRLQRRARANAARPVAHARGLVLPAGRPT